MTPHTFEPATVVHVHFTIALSPGSSPEVTVSSAPAHDTTPIHDLVSDADEFTSVPVVEPNGTGNGHTTLIG